MKLYACIYPIIESYLHQQHHDHDQQRYDHVMICLHIASSIPEECDALDISRSSRTEIHDQMIIFSQKILSSLESYMMMLYDLNNHISSSPMHINIILQCLE